ncbi:MAG: T9SS type A sorting domain-containing protein [Chitinophagales bacterium]
MTLLLNSNLIIALGCFFLLMEPFGQFANAQAPAIEWQKTFGGSGNEYYGYILKLHDGNYLQYGNTSSGDGDFSSNQGKDDAYMIKTDEAGNILWSKTYGGKKKDGFNQVIEMANGNLMAAGYTASKGGDVNRNNGEFDGWLVQLNSNGNILSQHCYGGSAHDEFLGMTAGDNKEVYLTGFTRSTDGDLTGTGNHGNGDGWVIRVNKDGNMAWVKCVGGSNFDQFTSIITLENKIYVSGVTYSFDADATQNHSAPGFFDHFLARLDPNGCVEWTACHGGSANEYCNLQSLIATPDGNLMNVGTALSKDGDVSGHINDEADAWVTIISAETGALISQHCYGTVTRMQGLYSAYADEDGGYILVGADAADFKVDSTWNAMVIKIDADGNEVWKTTFGGSDLEMVDGLAETEDGGYLLACYTRSGDGDVTNQHGNGDSWLVKLSGDGEKISAANETASVSGLKNYPNPFSQSTTISFSLPSSQSVSLKIYDLTGRLVTTLADAPMTAGVHQLQWNARDVCSGIYFLKMVRKDSFGETANESETIRLSVMK